MQVSKKHERVRVINEIIGNIIYKILQIKRRAFKVLHAVNICKLSKVYYLLQYSINKTSRHLSSIF